MQVSVKVKVVVKHEPESYSSRTYNEELFEVTVSGISTKVVEEKIGKLQEAITHMGWALD